MARKWMALWSAIAVILLWKWADITDAQTATRWPDGAIFSRTGLTNLLKKGSANATNTASDGLTHPPLTQSFVTGDYRFVVTAIDEWQTPAAVGQLYQGDRLLWESSLPQQYGPRFVVVGSQGHVLLVDEFINVASPYALMLLGTGGEPVTTHAFEDIQQALSVSAADLTQQATSGWWVSAAPQRAIAESVPSDVFDEGVYEADIFEAATFEETVLISTGGTHLAVNLQTGELSSAQDLSSQDLSSQDLSSQDLSSQD